MATSLCRRAAALCVLMALCHGCASSPSPAEPIQQVTVLKHVDWKVALEAVRQLDADNAAEPKLVVVAHEGANSLLLSGPPELVSRARELVARIDTAR